MPQVSVIIPTYNRAGCVTEAIDSVLAQTFTDYEIIVVDDGSTDNTRAVLEPYRDRIRYIYQQNSGVSGARNAGIFAAAGDWIYLLDSDDELLPGTIAMYLENLRRFPDAVGHVGNVLIIGQDYEVDLFSIRRLKVHDDPWHIKRPLILAVHVNFFPQSLLFRRKNGIQAGIFETGLSLHEDTDFMYRLALQGPWLITPKPVACILRKDAPGAALSDQHKKNPETTPRNLCYIYGKLLAQEGFTKFERAFIKRELASALCSWATASQGKGADLRRDLLVRALQLDLSPKNLIRTGLPLLFGKNGLRIVAAVRRFRRQEKGFRRSEMDGF